MRSIKDELVRIGAKDIKSPEIIALSKFESPYYEEEVIEAVMNMFDISIEQAIKLWDNDILRADYYEDIFNGSSTGFKALIEYRINDLEEIYHNNAETYDEIDTEYEHLIEEAVFLNKIDYEEAMIWLQTQGWIIYKDVAILWDMDELLNYLYENEISHDICSTCYADLKDVGVIQTTRKTMKFNKHMDGFRSMGITTRVHECGQCLAPLDHDFEFIEEIVEEEYEL
jgi:hypothetical protein